MQTTDFRLEPMSIGGLLDNMIRIYMKHFKVLIALVLLLQLPYHLLNLLAPQLPQPFLWMFLANILFIFVLSPLSTGGITHAVSEAYLNRQPEFRRALSVAWDQLGTIVLTSIIVGLLVFGGFLLLIIPGVIVWLMYSLVIPVIILENADSSTSRERSSILTRDNRMKIFLVMVIVGVAYFALLMVLGGLTVLAGTENSTVNLITEIAFIIVQVLITPMQMILVVLLYYDLRIRKEAFDLEMLSGAVERIPVRSTLGVV